MKRLTRISVLVIGLLVCLGGLAVAGLHGWIYLDVQDTITLAQAAFPQADEPVLALIEVSKDPDQSMRARNRAVWALGRLKDMRALPHLESMATDKDCDHDQQVCQYELEKAIRRCGGS